jgi:hypothetical protein
MPITTVSQRNRHHSFHDATTETNSIPTNRIANHHQQHNASEYECNDIHHGGCMLFLHFRHGGIMVVRYHTVYDHWE